MENQWSIKCAFILLARVYNSIWYPLFTKNIFKNIEDELIFHRLKFQ